MFSNHYYKFSTECSSEKILNIGQYLANIWTKLCGLLFWATLYMFSIELSSLCCPWVTFFQLLKTIQYAKCVSDVVWSKSQSHRSLNHEMYQMVYTEQQRMYCNIVGRFLLHCVRNFCTSSVLILVLQFTVRNVFHFLASLSEPCLEHSLTMTVFYVCIVSMSPYSIRCWSHICLYYVTFPLQCTVACQTTTDIIRAAAVCLCEENILSLVTESPSIKHLIVSCCL